MGTVMPFQQALDLFLFVGRVFGAGQIDFLARRYDARHSSLGASVATIGSALRMRRATRVGKVTGLAMIAALRKL